MSIIIRCVISGGLAGLLNGLFGAGGGIILVPLLINWIKMEERKAFATSVAVILPLSIASYIIFSLQDNGVWQEALPYFIGGICGGLVSSFLFKKISTVWLHRIFGTLALYGAVKAVLLL